VHTNTVLYTNTVQYINTALHINDITSRSITIAGYLLLAAATVLLEMYARRPGARVPSFARLCGYLMRDRWGRLGVFLLWFWLGWHFLARS